VEAAFVQAEPALLKLAVSNIISNASKYTENGGLIIDLAWNIGANDIIGWCHDHNVLYVNMNLGP